MRRGRLGTVCARGAHRAWSSGPSTSPLGAMFIRVACLLTLSAPVAAQSPPWTPYNQGLEQQHQVSGEARAQLDHLTPFDLPQNDPRDCLASFRILPSFTPPEGWCLLLTKDGYRVETWKTTQTSGNAPSEVAEASVPVDKGIADLIQEIWINVLLDTHYPRAYSDGLDGTYYSFQSRSRGLDMRARTWSPSGERPPAWLVSAASEVMLYARSQGADPERLRTDLAKCKERVFSYYRRRGGGGA
jgi:hypothetical protein